MKTGILFIGLVAIRAKAIHFVDFRHDVVGGNIAIHMGASSITVDSDSDDAKTLRGIFMPTTDKPVPDLDPAVEQPAASLTVDGNGCLSGFCAARQNLTGPQLVTKETPAE